MKHYTRPLKNAETTFVVNKSERYFVLVSPRSLHAWESLGLGYLASYSYKFGFRREHYRFFSGEFEDPRFDDPACIEPADGPVQRPLPL